MAAHAPLLAKAPFPASNSWFLQFLQPDLPSEPVDPTPVTPSYKVASLPPLRPVTVHSKPTPKQKPDTVPSLSSGKVNKPQPEDLLLFDVIALGFFPVKYWIGHPRTWLFRDLLATYFRSRTSKWCKFSFKLWNGLKITQFNPSLFRVVGVRWVSPIVIMVDKVIFAKFLEVRKATTAIFSIQGVLPTHGFVEIAGDCFLRDGTGVADYNAETCKFFTKPDGRFNMYSREVDIASCSYMAPKRT